MTEQLPYNCRTQLEQLLAELEHDLMLCTTRDQHIRVAQRIVTVKEILSNA